METNNTYDFGADPYSAAMRMIADAIIVFEKSGGLDKSSEKELENIENMKLEIMRVDPATTAWFAP